MASKSSRAWASAPSSFLDMGAAEFAAPLLAAMHAREERAVPRGGLPYEIVRRLGRGGMATVYLARDPKHDRLVAVKVLDTELTARVEAQRFVQEIRLTARLQHPHVLGLLDSGVFGEDARELAGRPYYVMPYVEGESLRDWLARHGPLALPNRVRLLREVADALSYAHAQGVVHRDIKPENILISHEHAVVADFGIATVTGLGALLGTPGYMAPEQATPGVAVDHRADLYAWGVMAYEVLAGRPPFDPSANARDLIAAHAREKPRPLADVAPDVPRDVAALVMRCLAKAPAERPGSAAELLALLDGVAIGRLPAGSSGVAGTTTRRRLLIAVCGVLLLVGAGALRGHRGIVQRASQEITVVGTGNPAVDVQAVQSAADRGSNITLEGVFSFAAPATKSIAPLLRSGWYPPAAEVLIHDEITISGARNARGEMATIEGGTVPFYVDAPGKRVTIRGVRFVRPVASAVLVNAARGLEISSSRIEGIIPFGRVGAGIEIDTRGHIPLPSSPGQPANISGHVLIAHNDIDATGGTSNAYSMGVVVFSAGQSPDREVDVDIIGNDIRNTTSSMVNIRHVAGRVRVLGNKLRTSPVGVAGEDAVRLVNGGKFLMANNTIECRWPNAAAITVFSPYAEWSMESAVVEDNDVLMSPPAGAVPGELSAGITVKGFAKGVVVRHNTVRGRGHAALAMYGFRGGMPEGDAFVDNRLDQFQGTLADIFVGSGVTRPRIAGGGKVSVHREGDVVER